MEREIAPEPSVSVVRGGEPTSNMLAASYLGQAFSVTGIGPLFRESVFYASLDLRPKHSRSWRSRCVPCLQITPMMRPKPSPPPAEKATTRQYKAWRPGTGDGPWNRAIVKSPLLLKRGKCDEGASVLRGGCEDEGLSDCRNDVANARPNRASVTRPSWRSAARAWLWGLTVLRR